MNTVKFAMFTLCAATLVMAGCSKKKSSDSWVTLGSAGFSAGPVQYASMAVDSSNTPYVVYQDGGNSNKATVMKFNGSEWEDVGSPDFSSGSVSNIFLLPAKDNGIYVGYKDA